MSRVAIPIVVMGKEFTLPPAQLHVLEPVMADEAEIAATNETMTEVVPAQTLLETAQKSTETGWLQSLRRRAAGLLHRYRLAAFALLFLVVGMAAVQFGGSYWSERVAGHAKPVSSLKTASQTIAGLNLTVPAKDLQAKLQTITGQPASLTVGSQTIPVGSDTIRSWLQITASADKSEDYIRIKAGTIADSLTKLAKQFVKAPVNQVTVSEDGISRVVTAGRNGTALSDLGSLATQSQQVAKTVMDAKGMQFNTPLQTVPFQAATPAAFDKLLVANVTAKKMWAFQNGQEINSWLVSAGKPSTPTPLGEFSVYAKFTVQDMRGFNPDGTKYFQPHVRWVNYFSAGSAIHGVYWHPLSWFGAINSSHGCVGLPEDQAKWVYDWAPIGTTVIVHA